MRSLGIIQARGASKRLPRKNVKLLNGAPLISYAVRTALASTLDRLIVTTEDDEIAELARRYGADVPFRRPQHLAADYASDEDILVHALDFCRDQEKRDYDIIVKLHPTTPFALPAPPSAMHGHCGDQGHRRELLLHGSPGRRAAAMDVRGR